MAAAQVAVELRQEPVPSQTLVTPQGAVAPQRVSLEPAPIAAQDPSLPPTLQALHAPQLEAPQHTPSTQFPLLHCFLSVQAIPFALSVQLFVPDP
jgi:hypothetical protein